MDSGVHGRQGRIPPRPPTPGGRAAAGAGQEIGTGSGYQAAVPSRLARQIYSLERIPELAEGARQVLQGLGINNVEVLQRDGSGGLPEHAPYLAIVVTAAAPRVPAPLKEQLAEGGRLVLPVGSQDGQVLERWMREGGDFRRQRVAAGGGGAPA